MSEQFFPYRRDERWTLLFKALRVGEGDGVTLRDMGSDHAMFIATYGRKRVETPVANIAETTVTGGHRWYTAVGLRLSLADDGLTFGTNHHEGLCVTFREKIPRVIGFRDHSSLWVSVADPAALAAAIGA